MKCMRAPDQTVATRTLFDREVSQPCRPIAVIGVTASAIFSPPRPGRSGATLDLGRSRAIFAQVDQGAVDGGATVNLYEAKTSLSRLVERAAAGEEIIIAKAGKPKARLVPLADRALRKPGGWKARSGSPTISTSPCRPRSSRGSRARTEHWRTNCCSTRTLSSGGERTMRLKGGARQRIGTAAVVFVSVARV